MKSILLNNRPFNTIVIYCILHSSKKNQLVLLMLAQVLFVLLYNNNFCSLCNVTVFVLMKDHYNGQKIA